MPSNMHLQDVWKFTPVFYRILTLGSHFTSSAHHTQAGHRVPMTMCEYCAILGWLVLIFFSPSCKLLYCKRGVNYLRNNGRALALMFSFTALNSRFDALASRRPISRRNLLRGKVDLSRVSRGCLDTARPQRVASSVRCRRQTSSRLLQHHAAAARLRGSSLSQRVSPLNCVLFSDRKKRCCFQGWLWNEIWSNWSIWSDVLKLLNLQFRFQSRPAGIYASVAPSSSSQFVLEHRLGKFQWFWRRSQEMRRTDADVWRRSQHSMQQGSFSLGCRFAQKSVSLRLSALSYSVRVNLARLAFEIVNWMISDHAVVSLIVLGWEVDPQYSFHSLIPLRVVF